MRKRILTYILTALMAFTALFAMVGCSSGKAFTVTFDGNGGELYHGQAVQTVNNASEIVEPIFIRDGYNFVSWSSNLSTIEETKTVKANWSKYKFTVTFDGNGGFVDGKYSVAVECDDAHDVINGAPKFEKQGYSLSWDVNLGGVTDTCTVNAVWTPVEAQITFEEDGVNPITVSFDGLFPEMPTPEKDGFRLAGWKDENGKYYGKNTLWQGTESLTLYPDWVESSRYIITYDLNGGRPDSSKRSFVAGNDFVITMPTRPGHSFAGWIVNGQGEPQKSLSSNEIVEDTSLTAVWSKDGYNLSFNTNGGRLVGSESVVVYYGSPIGTLPTVEKDYYKFIGWRYQGAPVTAETVWTVDDNAILVAEYKKVYKVSFSTTSIVRNVDVPCRVIDNGSFVGGTNFEEYVLTIIEGQTLKDHEITIFPIVDPIEYGGLDEYSFGNYWKYIAGDKKLHKVLPDTVFNDTNFPNVPADGTIVIRPHCRAHWTPAY